MAAGALTATVAADPHATVLRRLQAGDDDAKRELFAAFGERIWRLLFRLLGDYDEAHDLTQETFLRAFDRAHSFDARGSVVGWLSRIALNLARDDLRRRRRRRDLLSAHGPAHPAQQSIDPLLQARLQSCLDELSDVERVVVVMHDMEEYTHEEIAEAVGIAPGSSRARLSRARARLRAALGNLGSEVEG